MSSRHKEAPIELEVNNVFAHTMTPPPTVRCAASPGGFFGVFDGDIQPVNYFYQVETVPNEQELDQEIVSKVETAVLNSLLPELFGGLCSSESKRSIRMRAMRRLELLGASTQPVDRHVVGVDCEGELSDGANCFVVDGKLTLFGDDSEELDGLVEVSRDIIRERMNSGAYNNVDGRVINITFRNDTNPVGNGGTLSNGGSDDDVDDGSGLPVYGWIFIALAPLILCIGLVYFKHRADKRKEEGSFPIATSSEDIIPYEDPVLGLTVSTPEVVSNNMMAPFADGADQGLGSNHSSPVRGIGIASRQSPSLEEDYIVAMSTTDEPDAWEPFQLS